jgi:hypothetical protein
MTTSGKGKAPFGSAWPTPEGVTGKDLDPRSAGDAANETALKDFFFGGATVHAGGAASFAGAQSVLTAAAPVVIRKGGAVSFAGAQSTLTAGAGSLVPGASVAIVYRRDFNSYRGATRRRYNGGSGA